MEDIGARGTFCRQLQHSTFFCIGRASFVRATARDFLPNWGRITIVSIDALSDRKKNSWGPRTVSNVRKSKQGFHFYPVAERGCKAVI